MFWGFLTPDFDKLLVSHYVISMIRISLFPLRTSSQQLTFSARAREDVLEMCNSELGGGNQLGELFARKWRDFNQRPHEPALLAFSLWQL